DPKLAYTRVGSVTPDGPSRGPIAVAELAARGYSVRNSQPWLAPSRLLKGEVQEERGVVMSVPTKLLIGTNGHETLDVSGAAEAYEVHGLAGHDVIRGSAFDDLIVGGPGADQLFGNDGDDVFLMESADTDGDKVYGGNGTDTILGTTADDVMLLLSISSIELIDGGGGTDILRGTEGANYWNLSLTTLIGIQEIDGAGGHDQITGSADDDRIRGGAGNDILEGGAGNDTAVYSGNFAGYTLTALSGGRLQVATAVNSDGTDTLRDFEVLEFADGVYANGVFTPFGDPTNTAPRASADRSAESRGGTEER